MFPRILGIEAVGVVEEAPGGEFQKGDVVATAMGGLGRPFDGGYAEFTCPPASQVQVIRTKLPWETPGALPEMLQTAWGSLFRALRLKSGERLLVRGGTTSVGLAAAAIARKHGASVAVTTRGADREAMLRENGADEVYVDDGTLAARMSRSAVRPDKVLELVGATSLLDSLRCCLTSYSGDSEDFLRTPLEDLAQQVAEGSLRVTLGRTFRLDDIAEAHRCMEENRAGGKIVVVT